MVLWDSMVIRVRSKMVSFSFKKHSSFLPYFRERDLKTTGNTALTEGSVHAIISSRKALETQAARPKSLGEREETVWS